MPLAEFLRLMAQSHITLIHGKCGKLLKGQWLLLGVGSVLDWVNFLSSHPAKII